MRTISLDIECTKIPRHLPWIEGAYLVAVGIADQQGNRRTFKFPNSPTEMTELQDEIDKADRIVGHNLKFDLIWLRSIGVSYSNCKLWCTQVAEYLINGQAKVDYSLAAVSKRRGLADKIDRVKVYWNAGYETDEIPPQILLPYLEQDCINALTLFQRQVQDVKRLGLQQIISLQMDLVGLLAKIESNGMPVDVDKMQDIIKELQEKLSECEFHLKDLLDVDINLNSGDELSAALFGGILKHECSVHYIDTQNAIYKEPFLFRYKSGREVIKVRNRTLKMLVSKTRKGVQQRTIKGAGFIPAKGTELSKEGYYATNKTALFKMRGNTKRQQKIRTLLDERSNLAKALETLSGKGAGTGLINKVRVDGRIHGSFNQTVTSTGRLSSTDPNLQNQPRSGTSPLKKIFVPHKEHWVIGNADLAQLEWRVAACLANDQVAIKEILENQDYHRDNAIKFFGADPSLPNDHSQFKPHRTNAKVFGFRLLYGGTEYGMIADPKMPTKSIQAWKDIVDGYWEKYAGIKAWQDRNIRHVYECGTLRSPSGRILTFPKGKSGEPYLDAAVKNYPVQSFATADIMPLAMLVIDRRLKERNLPADIICQVHDSIVFEFYQPIAQELGELCIKAFEDLPRLIHQYWGYQFCVPLTGDFEFGESYGELKHKIERK